MSIRDGLEPSRSQDSETNTRPLPATESTAPRDEAPMGPGDRATTPPPSRPADDAWPPSWGESPSWGQTPGRPDDPAWTQPPGAKGPSWTQAPGAAAAAQAPSPATGPAGPGAAQGSAPGSTTQTLQTEAPRTDGPSWTQTQTGPGQGGGHPATPTWGTRPADGGSPRGRGRRPSRWLAAVIAGIVLLASGYG